MNNEKGFTLLELLLGLTLLAIGLLAMAGIQIASVKGNYFSKNITGATIIAGNRLEQLRNLDYNDAELSHGLHVLVQVPNTPFSIQHNVVENSGNSFRTIMVSVSWIGSVNSAGILPTHRVELSTIRAK